MGMEVPNKGGFAKTDVGQNMSVPKGVQIF